MATVYEDRAATVAGTLPERFDARAAQLLIAADAIALALAALVSFAVTRDGRGTLATVTILAIVAVWTGRYRRSFALRPRDELYAGIALALEAAPFAIIAALALDTSSLACTVLLLLAAVGVACAGIFACARRRGPDTIYSASIGYVDRFGRLRARSIPTGYALRALDIVLALVAVVLFSPLLAACAIAVAVDSGMPVLFTQQRVGRNDRLFTMFKFRTMRPESGSAWVRPGDDRITRVGAFLRRTSLDELPQLFNVLAGEMSLVGPRPEMPEYALAFEEETRNYPDRHILRPGITGWAQIHCPRNLQPSDMPLVLGHDLFYVANLSVHLYVLSLVQTVFEVLSHNAV